MNNLRQYTREDSEIIVRTCNKDRFGSLAAMIAGDNRDFDIMLERETFTPPSEDE